MLTPTVITATILTAACLTALVVDIAHREIVATKRHCCRYLSENCESMYVDLLLVQLVETCNTCAWHCDTPTWLQVVWRAVGITGNTLVAPLASDGFKLQVVLLLSSAPVLILAVAAMATSAYIFTRRGRAGHTATTHHPTTASAAADYLVDEVRCRPPEPQIPALMDQCRTTVREDGHPRPVHERVTSKQTSGGTSVSAGATATRVKGD